MARVHSVVTVGATSTEVLGAAPNGSRDELILVNDSNAAIYVSVDGNAAVMNQGIRLNASGGSIAWFKDDKAPGAAIYAISAAGDKKLLVTYDA